MKSVLSWDCQEIRWVPKYLQFWPTVSFSLFNGILQYRNFVCMWYMYNTASCRELGMVTNLTYTFCWKFFIGNSTCFESFDPSSGVCCWCYTEFSAPIWLLVLLYMLVLVLPAHCTITGRSRDRFPMVSLEFFIDIILSAALWPWGRLSV
jgi:hypothetical protein